MTAKPSFRLPREIFWDSKTFGNIRKVGAVVRKNTEFVHNDIERNGNSVAKLENIQMTSETKNRAKCENCAKDDDDKYFVFRQINGYRSFPIFFLPKNNL